MSDLLRDVDEMMRQERLMEIWRTWGNYIIGGILAVILAVALDQAYDALKKSGAEKNTAALQVALNDADPVKALSSYADKSGGNKAAVARLLAAQKMLDGKQENEAEALFLAVRNDASVHTDLRELATLGWARIQAGKPDAKADELIAALSPLMRDDGRPFAWSARLEMAVITANLKQDPKGALDILQPMLDTKALPYTQSDRAQALASVYRLRLAQTPAQEGK